MTNDTTRDTNSVLNEALRLAKLGYYVAPVKVWLDERGTKRMTRLPWSQWSTRDEATLKRWFRVGSELADHDLLIDCGKSGIVVVDLDQVGGKDGAAEWKRLGGPAATMVALTRSGGFHGYYKAVPGRPVRNSAGEVAQGIDVRGIGGAVFAPPTVVGNEGGAYTWLSGPLPVNQLPDAPAHLLTLKTDTEVTRAATGSVLSSGGAAHVLGQAQRAMLDAVEGENWNSSLNYLAFVTGRYCGAMGETEDDAYERVLAITSQRADAADGLDEESHRTAWRAIRQGIADPWILQDVEDLIDWEAQGTDPKDAAELPIDRLESEFLSPSDIKQIPPPEYLIQGILPAQGLIHLFGASGSFKSFAMLSMVAEIGAGTPWFGYETKQAEVWVIVAEGVTGTGKRIEAWERHYGRPMVNVKFLPRPLQLLGKEMKALIELARLRKPGLIWFDTQARVTVGVEENSATDMGNVVHAAEMLRDASTGAVGLVHHSGHAEGRARGSTSVRGALSTEISVTRKDNAVTIDVTKQKDDAEVTGIELTAISVDIGESLDGQAISSLTLVAGTGPDVRTDPQQPPETVDVGVDVETYSGPGAKLLRPLAAFMAHNATGGAGRSRAEAGKWLGRKPYDGSLVRSWDVLIELGAIKPDAGSGKTGRSHWVPQHERE